MNTIVFDTETNGMHSEDVCQLSMIVIKDGEMTGLNRYFCVDRMEPHALKIHGLSKFMLNEKSGGMYFWDWARDYADEFTGAEIYVGHNVSQDMRVMRRNLSYCGIELGKKKTFCTMQYFSPMLKLKGRTGQNKPPNLTELLSYYRITHEDVCVICKRIFGDESSYHSHDARYDACATLAVVLEAQKRGDVKGVIEI